MTSSVDEKKWRGIVGHLEGHARADDCYPDPRPKLTDLPVVDQERIDEREILGEFWDEAGQSLGCQR